MPTTTYKGLSVQTTGSNAGTWGDGPTTSLNQGVIAPIDSMLGGIVTKTLSSTPVSLTATESQAALIRLVGVLSANVTVTTLCQGLFAVENATTGNFAVTITNGVGSNVLPPQYTVRDIFADTTNGCRARGLLPPGTKVDLMVPTAALHPSLAGEYVLPFGQALSTTTYAALFGVFGYFYGGAGATFNMPDLRGRAVHGMDNMGGAAASRVTTAGSGIDGATFGSVGGGQSHTISASNQLPPHTHGASATTTVTGTLPGTWDTRYTVSGTPYAVQGGTTFTMYSNTNPSIAATALTTVTVDTGTGLTSQPIASMPPTFMCNIMIKI